MRNIITILEIVINFREFLFLKKCYIYLTESFLSIKAENLKVICESSQSKRRLFLDIG